MRNRYNEQLTKLNDELTQMGGLCETAIAAALKALLDRDADKRSLAFEADSEIDKKEREIESLCLKLLLEQQPVASDLRLISSALKIISDMERIGDQASDIAEITKQIGRSSVVSHTDLDLMAKAAIKMVTDSVTSFVQKDLKLARQVVLYDDKIDDLFSKVKTELTEIIAKGEKNGSDCVDTLMIAKYLERIGDHAENIAQWVAYSITGQHTF